MIGQFLMAYYTYCRLEQEGKSLWWWRQEGKSLWWWWHFETRNTMMKIINLI